MDIFGIFRRRKVPSANLAKERLKIIVEHSRADQQRPEFLNEMRREILGVVNKYIEIDIDAIDTTINNNGGSEVLELNILLPDTINLERKHAKATATQPKARKVSADKQDNDSDHVNNVVHDESEDESEAQIADIAAAVEEYNETVEAEPVANEAEVVEEAEETGEIDAVGKPETAELTEPVEPESKSMNKTAKGKKNKPYRKPSSVPHMPKKRKKKN